MGGISVLILMGIFSSMMIIFLIILVILAIWMVLSYIFDSISIYSMSKRMNYNHALVSFIPIYNRVKLGKISRKESIGKILAINDLIKWLTIFIFINAQNAILANILFYLGVITIFLSLTLKIYLTHHIIKRVTPKYADLLTILNSVTLGVTRAFMLFIVRKNNKIYVEEGENEL